MDENSWPGQILRMAKNPLSARPAPARQRQPARVRHYLKQWRAKRGLTQERLAERVDVSRGLIAQYELGNTKIPEDMIYALADALQCSPGDLFDVNPLMAGEVIDITDELRGMDDLQRSKAIAYIHGLKAG